MKLRFFIPLMMIPLTIHAGDIKTKVRKDAIIASPVDAQGVVTVSAAPGCVTGMPPIQITAMNKETDMTVAGAVAPDGSFAIRVPASPKDKIKLTFMGANGKDKKVTVKVSKAVMPAAPPLVERRVERETVTVPTGDTMEQRDPAAGSGEMPEPSPPSDIEIIRQEDDLGASGVIE